MSAIPLILSIDFDFFVEEDPKLDLGHGEHHPIFFEVLWAIRDLEWKKPVRKLLPWSGPTVPEFHRNVSDWFCTVAPRWSCSAESHSGIIKLLDEPCDVINFDAHHDVHYGTVPSSERFVNCGNWASWGMGQGLIRNYTVVYPDWRRKFEERFPLQTTATKLFWSEFVARHERLNDYRRYTTKIFLCRSGAWVPPCYDRRFNQLSNLFLKGKKFRIPPRNIKPNREVINHARRR